jgi:glutamine amidotransferase
MLWLPKLSTVRAFVSMISIDNVFAMQFHPEKSQHYGLMILKNFGEL